ncbi:ATP-binding protein [Pyrobaculum ferrireducens]|uniref:ATPase domain-containing protein n=1 Tax=Pyrobaculum ferrireducens TaxID=1104324 RepID=G7VIG2_9CREN|nr:ATP-binding protein [Pyrobaculum ferrireducens]AET33442.1 hypothetical protein P186_2047 [Pyrobaculum ferrireducens]
MKKIKLGFANLEVEFVDREKALRKVEEWAERGTALPHVVYGPEGCGKTAWLRQSAQLLRELGFDVVYINPVEQEVSAEVGVGELRKRLLEILRESSSEAWARAAWVAVDVAKELIRRRRGRLALIIDDAFQAIGLDKAALYVKGLLGILEHPPASYDKIIAVVATSEGVSLREIGRHLWSTTDPMWNMPRDGFEELYSRLPGEKPSPEEAWRLTGGNPRALAKLYEARWDHSRVINSIIREKGLTHHFLKRWENHLREAVEDPDHLWHSASRELVDELVEKNLIIYHLPERSPESWIDQPPPERDPELGIGRYVAWQTPLHREAVKRALKTYS